MKNIIKLVLVLSISATHIHAASLNEEILQSPSVLPPTIPSLSSVIIPTALSAGLCTSSLLASCSLVYITGKDFLEALRDSTKTDHKSAVLTTACIALSMITGIASGIVAYKKAKNMSNALKNAQKTAIMQPQQVLA